MATTSSATSSGDLADLISSTGSTTVYPSDDTVLTVLQARFRSDLPYSRVGSSNYIVVNPLKMLSSSNEESAKDYEERAYKDTSLPTAGTHTQLQPHVYELAARVYLLMRRRSESQAVVFRGITGSGKSWSSRLLLQQLLRLSAHSRRETKLSEQIKAMYTLLDSFGCAKTVMNPSASRHGRYLELHFNDRGRIASGKVLAYGLDKSRLSRLSHEERSFHVFYQLLAGATPQERDALDLEDPSDYAILASSGCYRLPSGPFSDDGTAMEELRAAMRTVGFKPKHTTSIFSLLVAILVLSNIHFVEGVSRDDSAHVADISILDHAARLLQVSSEELGEALTTKSQYVRKELYTVLLNAEQSAIQRDHLVRDLYAILFAFVVETANHKIAPAAQDDPPATQIILLDQPGFHSRGASGTNSLAGNAPLVSAYGANGFDEFCVNFQDEFVQSYVLSHLFDDALGYNGHATGDGVSIPSIQTMDNLGCIELLRGEPISERAHKKPGGMLGAISKACSSYKSGKSGEEKDAQLLEELVSKYGLHTSFTANPDGLNTANKFGINHYAGSCSYDVGGFIEKDADVLDAAFVSVLRSSNDTFISKLVSGPSLATEKHPKDETVIVQAQVSSRPLRQPTAIRAPDGSLPPADTTHAQLDFSRVYPVTTQLNFNFAALAAHLDRARLWTVSCIRPNDSGSPNSFDKRRVRAQIRALCLPDMAARRKTEFVVDFDKAEFCDRYVPTMQGAVEDRIRQCASANGFKEGSDYAVGHRAIWLSFSAWKIVEDVIRSREKEKKGSGMDDDESVLPDDATEYTHQDGPIPRGLGSSDNLLSARSPASASPFLDPTGERGYGHSASASGLTTPAVENALEYNEAPWGSTLDDKEDPITPSEKANLSDAMITRAPNTVEVIPTSKSRRAWLLLVMLCTWWIPDFLLKYVGRMKRPDIRLAWREKVTIFMLILGLCGTVLFYIIVFGRLLCPNFDKAWDTNELAEHTGTNDFYVAVSGNVYDVSKFIHGDHSDVQNDPSNSENTLEELAGQDLTNYFTPPLVLACQTLVTNPNLQLTYANFTPATAQAVHYSGANAQVQNSALNNDDWYTNNFLPTMKQYHKGAFVWDPKSVLSQAQSQIDQKVWAFYNNKLFDLTDYLNTITVNAGNSDFEFLNNDIVNVFKQQAGQDITGPLNNVLAGLDANTKTANMDCLQNMFLLGESDFRKTARCEVQNYFLLAASIILCVTIGAKFLAALQLTSKRMPEMLDKFIICQVPCYTEGEDSLRATIDSLAALKYDDKRKLLFLICDGNIIGSGNDRTTPRIVLDILGVDPKLDPEPLMFKSVGEGSMQINYGKVYSGLYEFEGHVVPYVVVVKVGKPTERSKPGNRGKRDSQILLMHYLNRVHFDAPMSPLELEIYHQMRNVIGIDPAFYEYIFMVDADTTVTPESLNRLVASCSDDAKVIGICGETKLRNEEGSWWTMIQVYEYYISHHLAKAFESLFGSVTCLPGCFSMYRIRTADKGRPLIISNRVIEEYSEGHVDTLHKKNLLSLGEDRYLTTLMTKHYPTFKMKFSPDAVAHTTAPESWSVLLSQRRRWINSTVHNLCELVFLPDLCGVCCFSMRFIVFIDLLGTIILPATVVYLVYLIVMVATKQSIFPELSIIMIAITYGLQAIIFILKREFMLVGWMVVYLISYPVYSFFLPLYSFWCMDDFSWGNTRLVVGEGNNKKVIMNDDEKYDESMIPLKKFSEYEAEAWETGSVHQSDSQSIASKTQSRQPQTHSRQASNSPRSYHQASQSGDFYRDTNAINPAQASNLHLGSRPSLTSLSQYGGQQQPMSVYNNSIPQLPFIPFGHGPGSAAGSDYGHGSLAAPMMGYQNPPSMYGMAAPRNTVATNLHMFGGSQSGAPSIGPSGVGRPMSTFSMATSVNPFAGPSQSTNPSDEELRNALRMYLSTQDLMTVTKKTTREAIMARFPNADLSTRKDFLNQTIDSILSES